MDKKLNWYAFLIFLFCAIALTWPLILKFSSEYPSPIPYIGGDPNMFIWYAKTLASFLLGKINHLGNLIYYPNGIHWFGGYDAPIIEAVMVPLLLIGTPVLAAYNVYIIFCLVSSAYAAYWVFQKWTTKFIPSLLGGFAFGFSVFMLVRISQHPNLIFLAPVPLFTDAVLDFFKDSNYKKAGRVVLFLFLTLLSSWYYVLCAAVIYVLCWAFSKKKFDRHLIALKIGIFAVVLLFSLPMILSPAHGENQTSTEFMQRGSAALLNFIVPHPFTGIAKFAGAHAYLNFPSLFDGQPDLFESTSYLGLLLLPLIYYIFKRKKIKNSLDDFLFTAAIIFIVFSLGPYIKIFGQNIPLPFLALSKIYPFSLFRVPNRFFVPALFACCALLARLSARFQERLPARKFYLFATLVFFGLLLERSIFPLMTTAIPVSQFYKNIGNDRGIYAVADLPIIYPGFSEYDYFQLAHNKPIVDGEFFYNVYDKNTFSFIKSNALLDGSICQSDVSRDVSAGLEGIKQLVDANIKFIVVHNFTIHDNPDCIASGVFIRKVFLGQRPYFADGEITVYRIK